MLDFSGKRVDRKNIDVNSSFELLNLFWSVNPVDKITGGQNVDNSLTYNYNNSF